MAITDKTLKSKDLIDGYLRRSDWQVKRDANVQYSFAGLMNHVFEEVTKNYMLINVFPKGITERLDGTVYIHDLGKGMVGYCTGWSLGQLLTEGLNGIPDQTSCNPPKHLESATDQMGRFLQILQNEWAGAQAFSSFDTYLAPFIRYDRLPYKRVKQYIQRFIYMLNTNLRFGGQIPFSNLTFDWTVPDDLKDKPVIIGGKPQKETYKDFQKEMDIINRAFLEVYIEGDATEQPFTFPLPTYNLTRDFNWDSKNANLLFELTAKYGSPYFQNFINSDLDPSDVRAMCCRLRMNLKDLAKKTGGLFGSGESTGSIGVVNVNMPRIGYLSRGKSMKQFLGKTKRALNLCRDILEAKRDYLTENLERGLVPYTKRYLGHLDRHFSTVSLIGANEMCLNYLGEDITTVDGQALALEILDFFRDTITEFQKETGNIYNLEAAPAESASYALARIDKRQFPKIITAGQREPYYTNSTHLPVGYTNDIFEALDLQDELQTRYTGGTIFHAYLGEKLSNAESCKELVRKIASNYRLPYFTISPTFSICQEHGYLTGIQRTCPKCKEPTLVYSRIVGYMRPVQQWNKGKSEEFKERKTFKVAECGCSD